MELNIKEFGATVAIGAFLLFGIHFIAIYICKEDLPDRIGRLLNLRAPQSTAGHDSSTGAASLTWVAILIAAFSIGVLGKTLSHEAVHGNGSDDSLVPQI